MRLCPDDLAVVDDLSYEPAADTVEESLSDVPQVLDGHRLKVTR